MPKFKIPPPYQNGFKIFLGFSDKQRDELISSLEAEPLGAFPRKISSKIADGLGIKKIEADEIISALFSLYNLKDITNASAKQIADDLVESMLSFVEDKKMVSERVPEQILRILTSQSPFALTFKSADLFSEREKLVVNTRIISDIRPIFCDGGSLEIEGATVIHTLKIEYDENGATKEIFLGLDDQDLKKLKENIQRAEQKSALIPKTFGTQKIKFIEIEE
jgi:hypothetical protein